MYDSNKCISVGLDFTFTLLWFVKRSPPDKKTHQNFPFKWTISAVITQRHGIYQRSDSKTVGHQPIPETSIIHARWPHNWISNAERHVNSRNPKTKWSWCLFIVDWPFIQLRQIQLFSKAKFQPNPNSYQSQHRPIKIWMNNIYRSRASTENFFRDTYSNRSTRYLHCNHEAHTQCRTAQIIISQNICRRAQGNQRIRARVGGRLVAGFCRKIHSKTRNESVTHLLPE